MDFMMETLSMDTWRDKAWKFGPMEPSVMMACGDGVSPFKSRPGIPRNRNGGDPPFHPIHVQIIIVLETVANIYDDDDGDDTTSSSSLLNVYV